MTKPAITVRGNPLVRITLSALLLALGVYVVIQNRNARAPKPPVVPAFRSKSPSAEGANSFAWIPRYPGAEVTNIRTKETSTVLNYGFEYQSTDPPAAILKFYDQKLRDAGFTVVSRNRGAEQTDLHAENPDRKRLLDVGLDKAPTGATVIVAATEQ